MRTVTTHKTVYTLSELIDLKGEQSTEASEAVRQVTNTDYEWYEYTFDLWKQALASIGIEDAEIQFSGFWSQGDGASFTAGIDIAKLVAFLVSDVEPSATIGADSSGTEDFRPWLASKISGGLSDPVAADWLTSSDDFLNSYSFRIERTFQRYSHANTCRCSADGYTNSSLVDSAAEQLSDDITEISRSLMNSLYSDLEQEHEYLTSLEAAKELCGGNGYEFDERGNLQ